MMCGRSVLRQVAFVLRCSVSLVGAELWGITVAAFCGGCTEPMPVWSADELRVLGEMSAVGEPPPSRDNEYADQPRAAALGKRFFFDPKLSSSGHVSCGGCHMPARTFTDGRGVAVGARMGRRNTPTLLGTPWLSFLGWDGRTDSVWAQSLAALGEPAEHDMTPEDVASLVARSYREAYEAVFGPLMDQSPEDVWMCVGKALEAYVRTLRLQMAPFDEYVAALQGGDGSGGRHLSPKAVRGLAAFLRQGCISCHHGPWLTDGDFHNLGLPPSMHASDTDPGRTRGVRLARVSAYRCTECKELRYLDARFPDFLGAFKTPTLRNVAETGPYMHTGQMKTLEAVVEFYRKLPGEARVGRRDPQLEARGQKVVTREMVAFLKTLTSEVVERPLSDEAPR